MDRLFCSVPKDVKEWLEQLALKERTTISEILRRIVVSLHDDQQSTVKWAIESAPFPNYGYVVGGGVMCKLADDESLLQTKEPYYLWLASGIDEAEKRIKLVDSTLEQEEKSVLDRLRGD